jgi:hypothetical protein
MPGRIIVKTGGLSASRIDISRPLGRVCQRIGTIVALAALPKYRPTAPRADAISAFPPPPSPFPLRAMPTPQELLERLDSRHDELIHKLDELNAEIERALAEFATSRTAPIRET